MPSCTTARLASMFFFIRMAAGAPRRFSRTSVSSRASPTEARTISYAAKTLLKAIMTRMTASSMVHMGEGSGDRVQGAGDRGTGDSITLDSCSPSSWMEEGVGGGGEQKPAIA
jgi:hypothetical protein